MPVKDKKQHEIIGIALKRIGSIIESDEYAEVSFQQEIDRGFGPGLHEIGKETTSVTLEVSGVEE